MKILAMVHGFPPHHNAGAEWMLYDMLKYLVDRGHKCVVYLSDTKYNEEYNYNGIEVKIDEFNKRKEELKTTDIVFSHLDRYGKALNIAEFYRKPYVLIVHNTHPYSSIAEKHKPNAHERFVYCVYNSEYTRDALHYPNPSVIVHPPVSADRVKTKRGDKITLINCWADKGGLVMQEIARLMPDHNFIGVKGGYGEQEIGKLKNIKYLENTPDIRKVYAQSRIVLMPSKYESYGRVAVEAMASGIPVIAEPTPGLKESLGEAGIFCDRNKPEEWVEIIKKLDDEKLYKAVSANCVKRFAEIQALTEAEMKGFEEFLINIINKKA